MGQIAAIRPAQAVFTRVTSDGQDAILVNIRQSPTGDTVAIAQSVAAPLKEAGVTRSVITTPYYDQSELVTGAAKAVRDAILMSALIAIPTLAPLALGISRGAGLQTPLATAIIFGLIAAAFVIKRAAIRHDVCLAQRVERIPKGGYSDRRPDAAIRK